LGPARPEIGENLEIKSFTPQEIGKMIKNGEIQDGKTLIALLKFFSPA